MDGVKTIHFYLKGDIEMKIEDYESRMVHDGKRNNREVKIICELCGNESWQRWQRVKQKTKEGKLFFCSLDCANEYQRQQESEHIGKENARFHFDKSRGVWYAYWWEEGKLKNTTKSKWLWEMNYGEISDGYVVTYKDRNPENCELENLEIVTRGQRTSEALLGHVVSDETKEKLSEAHLGKTLSEEHKQKISDSLVEKWDSGEYDSVHKGEYHRKWRGGVPKEYPREFSNLLKKGIMERDNGKCRICHKEKSRVEVHHMDGNKYNNEPENLITLCSLCHRRVHEVKHIDDPVILAFRSLLNS